jgi:glycosyltransferase involved in cell wall biosynthesis
LKPTINFYFRAPSPNNFSIENLFDFLIGKHSLKYNCRKLYTKGQFDVKAIFKKAKADIHHVTGAVNYLVLGLPGKKTILTVHDIGYYENPIHAKFKRLIYGLIWFRLPLLRARYITVVSEFTKSKLIQNFGLKPNKIVVIPNPILSHFITSKKKSLNKHLKILQIGTGAHKNLIKLINAVADLNAHILIVGSPSKKEIDLMKSLSIQFDIFRGISNDEVYKKYVESDILFFASLYEGFGMPIIEAQKVGRPVITSNFGAMKEVADNSAILVNPQNDIEIRSAIIKLMSDRAFYDEMVERGLSNVKRFEPDVIVNKYQALYEEISKH